MLQNETLRVIESAPAEEQASEDTPRDVDLEPATHYEGADEVDLQDYDQHYSFPRFVTAVLDELGKEYDESDARVVDAMPETLDIHFGILLAFPDESLMFVGSDPTAKDAIPWFAFTIEPMEPMPTPGTAQEALDLLKPPEVRDVVHDEDWLPDRHGEWWLLPTKMIPGGTVFTPGVSQRPYGPSPLGNHVPREYAFTVTDDTFMGRFASNVAGAPESIGTPPEAIEWTCRQLQKANPPEGTPSWADIRSFADDVLVRGTIRHRDDDHYVENVGSEWHKATTHNVEVYTGDEMATDVHLDYHGR